MRGIISILIYGWTVIFLYAPYIASAKAENLTYSQKMILINYVKKTSVLKSFDISDEIRLHVTLNSNTGYDKETKYITYIYNLYKKISGFSDKKAKQTINISIGNGIVDAVKNGELETMFPEEAKNTISRLDYCYGESSINKKSNIYITAIILYDPSIGGRISKCIQSMFANLFGFKISVADFVNPGNPEYTKFDNIQLRAIGIRKACYKSIGKGTDFKNCVESKVE